MIRSADQSGLVGLRRRVLACLSGGAEAAGARLVVRETGRSYREMRHNLPLAGAFEANLHALGRRPLAPGQVPPSRAGSTDMGDVSQLVPAIHPKLAISPPEVVPHSPAFAAWAAGPAADRAVVDGAKALAMTALDVWLRPDLRAAMVAAFAAPAPTAVSRPGRRGRRRPEAPAARPAVAGHATRPGAAAGPGR
jgi:metal-dependent amidase/aminoacylase/carboxypeptidase family protein